MDEDDQLAWACNKNKENMKKVFEFAISENFVHFSSSSFQPTNQFSLLADEHIFSSYIFINLTIAFS